MKLFIFTTLLIGFVAAQSTGRRDTRCPMPEDARKPTLLPHSTDCNSFLKCQNGMAFDMRCPINQHWNTRFNACDTPENARCNMIGGDRAPVGGIHIPAPQPPRPQQPQPPRPQPPRPQQPNSPQRPSPIPNPRPQIEHPDFLNCPSVDLPGRVVYFPYHMNCAQFYQCVNGRAVLLTCPPNHTWDIAGNYCDRVENVRCATPRRPL